jgi:urea transport system permease protein
MIMKHSHWFLLLILPFSGHAFAASFADTLQRMTAADSIELVPLIEELSADGTEGPLDRKVAVLEALVQGRLLHDSQGSVAIQEAEGLTSALTGEIWKGLPRAQLKTWTVNNAVRRSARQALSVLQLQTDDPKLFLENLQKLEDPLPESTVLLLEKRWTQEKDPLIRDHIQKILANSDLLSGDPKREKRAVETLGSSGQREASTQLQAFLDANPDSPLRADVEKSLQHMKWRFMAWEALGHTLYGLSLASILLLVSLGLAITFGLMKIINMAHGEMLMIGAYSSYVLQSQMSGASWAFLAPILSLPLAFCVSAAVGWMLERTIIRRLYGRPLETLLASWGISLILIQAIRLIFGAQNVEVAVPAWLSGGWTLSEGLVIPFNRIFAIIVSVLVVGSVWIFFRATRWGLLIRAVQQNRSMAACLKISTDRVDAMTFAMGSGLAGIGGAILSQITNVGPEMGQSYIIDSFLVVVLGGVGNIGGAILGALSLGLSSKYLEAMTGAVLAKIIVMALIILFIQKRPEGLLAIKGRSHVIDV